MPPPPIDLHTEQVSHLVGGGARRWYEFGVTPLPESLRAAAGRVGSSDLLRGSSRSFGARLLVLPLVAVSALLASRIVIDSLGSNGFALYALVVGLAALVPFADLGIGAAVTDAVARRATVGDAMAIAVIRRSSRVLVMVGVAIMIASWAIAAVGGWSAILGVPGRESIDLAAAIALTLFAVSLPLSLGTRILLGAERNHWAVLSQPVSTLIGLAVIAVAAVREAPLWAFTSAPFLGIVVLGAVNVALARRATGLAWTTGQQQSVNGEKSNQPVRLFQIAGPMLVISVALPLAWQSDRLVLSHRSTLVEVALYVVAFQLFTPLYALIESGGSSLWPVFARRGHASGIDTRRMVQLTLGFAVVGLIIGFALALMGPWLATWVSRGSVVPSRELFVLFGLLIAITAAWWPTAMLLTDPLGLRFQALCCTLMATANIGLSIALAPSRGAAGPVIASLASMILAIILPGWWFAWRRLRRAAESQSSSKGSHLEPGLTSLEMQ